ncbi:alpha/beta fold hydrolase [Subtercola sp. YIM 133946]|uniref:alpha/beta fold hydrolase n=1 Tax=Subtercola sp. YIM 133946 TaxID=3118909 RepID=UPI002F91DFB2
MTYLTHDIPVAGGLLRVAEWRPDGFAPGDAGRAGYAPGDAGRAGFAAGDAGRAGFTPGGDEVPLIVALHGMTGSHLSWQHLAAQLPHARIIAPDLRGRGRSADLPGPYGIAGHVADLLAVVAALRLTPEASPATLIGHSLGAFVAVAALREAPQLFGRAILADGGLPLTVPLNLRDDDLVEAVMGVAVARRTELTFTSKQIYRKFWRLHPGFAASWSDELGVMADYDLTETIAADGSLQYRPVSSREAIEADARELYGSHAILAALAAAGAGGGMGAASAGGGMAAAGAGGGMGAAGAGGDGVAAGAGGGTGAAGANGDSESPGHPGAGNGTTTSPRPRVTVLTAARGLLNETPGVYSPREIAAWQAEFSWVEFVEVPNVNHYSLVLSARGAKAVAREYNRTLIPA